MTFDDFILDISFYHIPSQNGIAKTTEIIETAFRSVVHRTSILGNDYRPFTRFRYDFEPDVFRHEKLSENYGVKNSMFKIISKTEQKYHFRNLGPLIVSQSAQLEILRNNSFRVHSV